MLMSDIFRCSKGVPLGSGAYLVCVLYEVCDE